ncbi:protein neprosin-like [Henckelia pumila]|uniref:protein neprosin-like n=1 Tax=Henckelia pumila TaxID=405737 RepID=UPI003C6E349A
MGTTVCVSKFGGSFSIFLAYHVLLLASFLLIFSEKSFAISSKDHLKHTKYMRQVSNLRLGRIQRHLDKINKPPVFTIQSPDGDIIDCVHKRKQPALDHPLLKNHKIQRVRPEMPKNMMKMGKTQGVLAPHKININKTSSRVIGTAGRLKTKGLKWQLWHQKGEKCPKGTVPIRRSTVHDVLRAKSLYHYGKKLTKSPLVLSSPRRFDVPDVVSGNGHEHAIAYTKPSEEIYGAKATINVWNPSIELVNEFSLSQIWVLSGSFNGSELNSIEAGWQVSPELYGDNRPRLFTYWTSDAYQATGCYNLLCSGFVQTNNRIAIGAAISPVSAVNGDQYDITILVWKDPKLGHWWMGFGDSTLVGYWPAEIFTHLSDRATMVEWGGEIVNSRAEDEHTSTQMGSGHFADDGFGRASYFRNLEIVDSDNSLSSAQEITTLAENTNCYNIKSSYNNDWGTYFYYGGPGKSENCP